MNVSALRLDSHPRLALAVLELEALAGPIVGLLRLGAEAIVDVAAEGLNVEVGGGCGRKVEAQISAHRLSVELRVGREREMRGEIARDAVEAAARERGEIDFHVTAHRLDLDLARPALELDVAVDGPPLGRLRAARSQADGTGRRVDGEIAADLAADVAAHRAQIDVALETLHLEISAYQRRFDLALLRHVNHQLGLFARVARTDAWPHVDGGLVAAARDVHAVTDVVGRAGHLDFRPIPAGELDRSGHVENLDGPPGVGAARLAELIPGADGR